MKKIFENWIAPIGVLMFFLVITLLVIDRCNKKPISQYVEKVEIVRRDSIICILNKDNDSLRKLLKLDSIKYVNLKTSISKMKVNSVIVLEKIKTLPTDSGIAMSQRNYSDKSKIVKIDFEGKTKICLSESQMMENNISFYNVGFLDALSDTLGAMVTVLNNESAKKSEVIRNDAKIIEALNFKGESKDAEIQGLKDCIACVKGEAKRQRLLKNIASVVGLFLLVTVATK